MPTARDFLGVAAASNGKIYAIGGYPGGDEVLTTVEAFTPGWVEEVTANPQWLDESHYRTSFEFTSMIQRGRYPITSQDAKGLDGLTVAPYQGADFEVDYGVSITVTTPPNTPVVGAWGDGSLTTVTANWSATDPKSVITGYRYAIGTTPGGVDVVNWTNVSGTSLMRTGLNLTLGQVYYISIKARNEGGLWSLAGSSNGVKAGVTPLKLFIPMAQKRN